MRSLLPRSALGGRPRPHLALLVLSLPLWLLLAYGHRLYHLDSYRADYSAADEIGPVLQMATLWSWTVLLALAVVKPDNVAVSKIALFWLLTMFLTLALRSGARSVARRRVWYLQNALIIGPENQASAILQMLRHPEWGINVVACVAGPGARFTPTSTKRLMDFVPVLGAT